MKPVSRIYVHFADYYHVQRARSNKVPAADIMRNLSTALRLCLLFADEVIFPASSVFESLECRQLIKEFPEFREHGILKMSAGDSSVESHLESKRTAYNATSTSYFLKAYQKKTGLILPTYIERAGSSTKAIREAWVTAIELPEFVRRIHDASGVTVPPDFETKWANVPGALQGQAFVPLHAADALRKQGFAGRQLEYLVSRPIEGAYVEGYVSTLNARLLVGVPYLSYPLLEDEFDESRKVRYQVLLVALQGNGLAGPIREALSSALFALWCRPEWDQFANYILKPDASKRIGDQAADLRSFLQSETRRGQGGPQAAQLVLPIVPTSTATEEQAGPGQKFDIAIITALPIELAAVQQLVDNVKKLRVPNDPNSYKAATLSLPDGSKKPILLCMLNRMGNNSAATAMTNLERSFGVKHLFFCGIALGVPNTSDLSKHVRLGDVVVGDREGVIQMDHQSLSSKGAVNRSNLPPPPAALVRALNELEVDFLCGETPWNELIQRATESTRRFARPHPSTDVVFGEDGETVLPHPDDPGRDLNYPNVVRGKIGSSNTLVKDGRYRDTMAQKHDLRAMEMEAAGALEAAWNFGHSAMIVRGVCDYGVGKNDKWHAYAALAAAAVTVSLIRLL